VNAAKKGTQWLFIICVPVLLLTLVIGVLANSPWLYERNAEKYGVADALANAGLRLSNAELSSVYRTLIKYYNSGEEKVSLTVSRNGEQISILTPEETQHFKDVKGLIRLDYTIFSGAFVVCLAVAGVDVYLWRDRRRLGWGLAGGGILTLGLLLALFVLDSVYGFDNLFIQFHFMFFNNMFWSVPGNMLLLFPEGLFINAVTLGFAIIAGAALVAGVAGWWLKRQSADGR
jgi:integral membrane protein (TIGR01906 family)